MALIECRNASIGYDSKVVIENLSFKVNSGDYLCIIGDNGAGKSTLLNTILGLNPILSGEIIFSDGLEKSEIGYLPQSTVIQRDFPASVWEVVLSGCSNKSRLSPFYSKENKELAKKNLERMSISNLSKCCFRELSGGQQQRVLLARALCATEKILLLDEPVSGLDPKTSAEMYELVKNLNDNGTTIVMITHDINTSLNYASHILKIGKNGFFGTKEDYLKGVDEND